MTALMIVSYVFAGLVLLVFLRVFWRPIVFLAVLAWELLWKGLIPLLALPFRAATARNRRHGRAAINAPAKAADEREWMAAASAKVDAALAREPTSVTVIPSAPPERNEWRSAEPR